MNLIISKEEMLEGMNKMNSFGTRLTGSKGHNDFINWLKDEVSKMDIPIFSDPFYFRRWEEKHSSIEIIDGDGVVDIPISSAYPYSGETSADGITEELVYVDGTRYMWLKDNCTKEENADKGYEDYENPLVYKSAGRAE